jgi:hypothetical protein
MVTNVTAVLRISKWSEVFERAESRKIKQLSWIALPVSFTSAGYQSLLDEFGSDAPAIYGAWCALCAVASSCTYRGVLATSRGIPLRTSHIARTTGFDVVLFERLMAWAIRDEIGWLTTVSEIELATMLEANTEKTNENAGSCMSPGESPDMPGDRRGIPCTTRPNLTRPDITKQDITQPDQTGAAPGATPTTGGDDLIDRWKKPTRGYFDLVCEIASRFGRLPERIRMREGQELDREFIWQMSWIGAEFDRSTVDEICNRLASGEIKKPKSYAEAIVRKLCHTSGYEWRLLRGAVPPVPPMPGKQPADRKEESAA